MEPNERIPLSPSFHNATGRFSGGERIESWALVKELLHAHPEYGGRMAAKLSGEPGPNEGDSKPVQDWLEALDQLYDPAKVQLINGRLAILGLSQLDPTLRDYLASFGFIDALREEVKERSHAPLEELLRKAATHEPGLCDECLYALRLAEEMARMTGGQADTVLLMAALLYQGAQDPSPSPARAVLEAMSQKHPHLASQGSGYESTQSGAELSSESQVVELFALDRSYKLTSIPPSVDVNAPPAAPHTQELDKTLAAAGGLAARTSGAGEIYIRHLLGALIAASMIEPPPQLHTHLRTYDYVMGRLRRALLEFISHESQGDDIDAWELVLLASDFVPPAAGYLSDAVYDEAKDRLDIEREVATIAHVLTSRQVRPPLSLGLFGDWGSGKSFFMAKLRKYIADVAKYYRREEQTTGQPARWCSRVVQIDFNAWHFSDANLWASLVTRIYDELNRALSPEVPSDRELRQRIEAEVQQAEGMVHQAEVQLGQVRTRVSAAENALQRAQEKRAEQEQKLQGLIGDLGELLRGNAQVQADLEQAAEALGYPEAAQTYEALQELDADLKSFSGRASALAVYVFRSPWTLLLLAGLVIGLPVAISLLLNQFSDQISLVGERVAEISTFVFGLIAWLKIQVDRGMGVLDSVEAGMREAESIRQKQISEAPEVRAAHQELVLARSEEQAAWSNLQNAQAELQRLQSELEELQPERKLYRLIEERSRTAAYSQHLGIISLIRADFEKMSALLEEMAGDDTRDLKTEPPIQRIILYIDDLDRCRPERVIEVLEAVHLLLAFPLFIVVVGVDPRWLRHSLSQHYQHTLAEHGRPALLDGRVAPASYSTPQDYLEKIFQIPFALRPVERAGYQSLVADLLQPTPGLEPRERQPQVEVDELAPSSEGYPPAEMGPEAEPAVSERQPVPSASQPETAGASPAPQPAQEHELVFSPLNPRNLEFTDPEKADIDRLWPMFRTPRTVKRYVNIYRLLRASISSEEDVARFEGGPSAPGEYQVPLLLLATVTGFPNQATRFMYRLQDWLETERVQRTSPDSMEWDWANVIDALQPSGGEPGEGEPRRDEPAGPDAGQDGKAEEDPEWVLMLACLEQITRGGFQQPFSRAMVEKWARRVTRYSFSVYSTETMQGG